MLLFATDGMRTALGRFLAIIGGLTLISIAAGAVIVWVVPAILNTNLNPRERIVIDLAGERPSSVTLLPCGGPEETVEVIGQTVERSFGLCEGTTYVIMTFKAFDAVCTVPYSNSTLGNRDPWRFRIVGHKCELISY